ncbi:MAG: hypothetical protein Q8O89_08565 [Nanoarchaeota archaeon]|nr:hypothetical protein [Nanoarchaeota archaeon]
MDNPEEYSWTVREKEGYKLVNIKRKKSDEKNKLDVYKILNEQDETVINIQYLFTADWQITFWDTKVSCSDKSVSEDFVDSLDAIVQVAKLFGFNPELGSVDDYVHLIGDKGIKSCNVKSFSPMQRLDDIADAKLVKVGCAAFKYFGSVVYENREDVQFPTGISSLFNFSDLAAYIIQKTSKIEITAPGLELLGELTKKLSIPISTAGSQYQEQYKQTLISAGCLK